MPALQCPRTAEAAPQDCRRKAQKLCSFRLVFEFLSLHWFFHHMALFRKPFPVSIEHPPRDSTVALNRGAQFWVESCQTSAALSNPRCRQVPQVTRLHICARFKPQIIQGTQLPWNLAPVRYPAHGCWVRGASILSDLLLTCISSPPNIAQHLQLPERQPTSIPSATLAQATSESTPRSLPCDQSDPPMLPI